MSILTICKYNIHAVQFGWASPTIGLVFGTGVALTACKRPHLVVAGGFMGLKPQLYLIEQAELGIVDSVSKTGWTQITDIVIVGRTLRNFKT